MTNIPSQALAILRGSFEDVHCEEVRGGLHGGEHYLAVSFTCKGVREFLLLRIDNLEGVDS